MSDEDKVKVLHKALERVVAEAYPSLGFFPDSSHIILSEGALAAAKVALAVCDYV